MEVREIVGWYRLQVMKHEKFGVHSAMPMRLARELCPEAILVKGDHDSYSKHSAIVTDIIRDKAPLFEKASIDEFYLDLSGNG